MKFNSIVIVFTIAALGQSLTSQMSHKCGLVAEEDRVPKCIGVLCENYTDFEGNETSVSFHPEDYYVCVPGGSGCALSVAETQLCGLEREFEGHDCANEPIRIEDIKVEECHNGFAGP